jgi:SAM-dependent methyltransferase
MTGLIDGTERELPDFATAGSGLEWREPGIWFGRNQAKVSYPEQGNAASFVLEDRSFWFRHRNRCIIETVRRFAQYDVLLDIGGGNGYVAKGLVGAGVRCMLLEPGIDGALAAHARGIDPVICARLEDAGFAADSIAAAGMFDVLEHIEDDAAALRQVHCLLRPGGQLFLTVPAYPALFSEDDRLAGHFRRYTLASLTRVLAGSGFEIRFASYMFAPLPPLVFLLRTMPTRLGLRRGADPERDAADHAPSGLAAHVMGRLLDMEWRWLAAGRRVPLGGSCLCVARRG